ncbi:cell division protein FtsZ, partial [Candidatus Micrarchaeota archaeon CG06_land_8_20_14_3_00_50_6]
MESTNLIKNAIEQISSAQENAQAAGAGGMTDEDKELMTFIETSKPRIYVVGTGGSGSNTATRLSDLRVEGATIIAMNTDVQHLLRTRAHKKLLLGRTITKGLGAGSDPKVGEQAAQEAAGGIKGILKDASLVFITCGLGGGTGTGSAHVIAEQAKANGVLTVAVVTLPFASEGRVRMQNAIDGLNKLRKNADTVVVIPNDKLLTIAPDLPLNIAFKVCDEVLAGAVKGIVELVTKAGLVNLDFADLRTILTNAGCAVVGIGEASVDAKAEQRALIAVETAMNSPLLDVDISTSNRALVNVIGGEDMTLKEAELVVSQISHRISPTAHIIWGARV